MKQLKSILTAVALTVIFTAGATFAWSTTQWWGTDWIANGEEVSAQMIAENFEYLKAVTDDLQAQIDSGTSGGGSEGSSSCAVNYVSVAPVAGPCSERFCFSVANVCPAGSFIVSAKTSSFRTYSNLDPETITLSVIPTECGKYEIVCE